MERSWAGPVDERGTTKQKQRWEIAEGSAVNEEHAITTLCFCESSRAQGITGLWNDWYTWCNKAWNRNHKSHSCRRKVWRRLSLVLRHRQVPHFKSPFATSGCLYCNEEVHSRRRGNFYQKHRVGTTADRCPSTCKKCHDNLNEGAYELVPDCL